MRGNFLLIHKTFVDLIRFSFKMSNLKEEFSSFSFGGYQKIFSHDSKILKCSMKFAIYLPPAAEEQKVPVLYWLSGLTCTEKNFIEKAGAQQHASKHGLIIVAPDTSPSPETKLYAFPQHAILHQGLHCPAASYNFLPLLVPWHFVFKITLLTTRIYIFSGGLNIPGEDDHYDFGSGAGFYVDATQEPWNNNYKMFSYVTQELPQIINENFPVLPEKQSIMGHSMGGHGALICALKNPGKYQSVSAFAPISNPVNCNWGKKAFTGYLGKDTSTWINWDAVELIGKYNGPPMELLVEQGKDDQFLKAELLTDNLIAACKKKADGIRLILNMREKYDHSYYFIATFIGDHIAYHAKELKN